MGFIKGIAEDYEGNFWIATSNGITRFNHESRQFKKFNTADGLQEMEFEANAFLKTRDGLLLFGGINGFNSFYPRNIIQKRFVPPVYITDFQVYNQQMVYGKEECPLQKDISVTDHITPNHKQSAFSMHLQR